jgi:N-acyl-D-aspartate/D-glutamate deacylase
MVNYLLPYDVWEDGPLGVIPRLQRPETRIRFREALAAFGVPLSQITIAWTAAPGCKSLLGMPLDEYVRQRGKEPHDALVDLLIDSNLSTLLIAGWHQDELVLPLIKHDLAVLGSDGIYQPGGHVHPRVYGSAARWLGSLVRDRKLFSLEEAVHKASGKSAARFGLSGRGVLQEGAYADVIVFDAEKIGDPATYDNPRQDAVGIEHVAVNGQLIVGKLASAPPASLPGRYLRRAAR